MRRRRFVGSQRGQGVVELALTLPVLLMVVMGIVDFGRIFSDQVSVTDAARSGARYAIVNPTSWSSASSAPVNTIEGQIQKAFGAVTLSNNDQDISISYLTSGGTACGHYSATSSKFVANTGYTQATCVVAGSFIQVKVAYQYSTITPIIHAMLATATITSTSTMTEEQ